MDVRALAVKAEFADIENLKTQMMSKDELVTEMKRLLKAKVCFSSHRVIVVVVVLVVVVEKFRETIKLKEVQI